jgi:hypothetical protein
MSDDLSPQENEKLLNLLKKHMKVIGYLINDFKGLSPAFCTHRIPMEDQCEPVVDHQRRLTHAMREVVKKEVIKLLDAGIIYPVLHSEWVSEGPKWRTRGGGSEWEPIKILFKNSAYELDFTRAPPQASLAKFT